MIANLREVHLKGDKKNIHSHNCFLMVVILLPQCLYFSVTFTSNSFEPISSFQHDLKLEITDIKRFMTTVSTLVYMLCSSSHSMYVSTYIRRLGCWKIAWNHNFPLTLRSWDGQLRRGHCPAAATQCARNL